MNFPPMESSLIFGAHPKFLPLRRHHQRPLSHPRSALRRRLRFDNRTLIRGTAENIGPKTAISVIALSCITLATSSDRWFPCLPEIGKRKLTDSAFFTSLV